MFEVRVILLCLPSILFATTLGPGEYFCSFFFFTFSCLYTYFFVFFFILYMHIAQRQQYTLQTMILLQILLLLSACLLAGWLLLYGGSCSFRTNPVVVMAGCAYPTYETYDADGSLALRMDAMWHAILLSLLPSSVVLNCAGQTRNTHQTPQGTHPDASLSDVPVM